MAMTAEKVEQGILTAIQTALADSTLVPVYRCFAYEADDAEATEQRKYPVITIQASPNVPEGYKALYSTQPVAIRMITTHGEDPKRRNLLELYTAIRGMADTDDWTLPDDATGFSKCCSHIMDSESEGFDEDAQQQYYEINLEVRLTIG